MDTIFFVFFFPCPVLSASSTGPRDLGLGLQQPVDGCLTVPQCPAGRRRGVGCPGPRSETADPRLHYTSGGGLTRRAVEIPIEGRWAALCRADWQSRKISGTVPLCTRKQCNGEVDLSVDRVNLSASAIRVMKSSPRPRADYCRSSGCYELPCWGGCQREARVARWLACTSPIRARF